MKKLTLLFILPFFLAAATFVINTNGQGLGVTTLTTAAVDTTGANLIVFSSERTINAEAPTDSYGNIWTQLIAQPTNDTSYGLRMWYCFPCTVGTGHTFTSSQASTFGGASIAALAFAGVSGVDTGIQNSFDTPSGTSFTIQPGNITPSVNGDVVIAATAAGGGVPLNTDGFVDVEMNTMSRLGVAYSIQTSAVAVNPTFTWNLSVPNAAGIIAFKPIGGTKIRHVVTSTN